MSLTNLLHVWRGLGARRREVCLYYNGCIKLEIPRLLDARKQRFLIATRIT